MEIPEEARMRIQQRRLQLFPNAPKNTRCRICGKPKPNSVLSGSDIASVVCVVCKEGMLNTKGKKKKKKTLKGGAGSAKSHPPKPASPTIPNSISGWLEMIA